MIRVRDKRQGTHGEIWFTEVDEDQWLWLVAALPYFVHHDDIGHPPTRAMQRDSDLELTTLPQYACKAPATLFFPYITYIVRNWFDRPFGPTFIIPTEPLNRLHGRYWLSSLTCNPIELARPPDSGLRHGWINDDGSALISGDWPMECLELRRLAAAAQTMLLDEIQHVYDETRSSDDSVKTNTPSRHSFCASLVEFEVTKQYLDWYIGAFNRLFASLMSIGQRNTRTDREQCLLTGWTINRLAADVTAISTVDVPYIRKWQFFGFLDGVATLKNEFLGISHRQDAATAQDILTPAFFRSHLEPVLAQIPVDRIRQEVVTHTEAIYNAIADMQLEDPRHGDNPSGPELLRLYRNSRHGYALMRERDRHRLIMHSGQIPDSLPDLCIALWHYILLSFPNF